MKNRTKLTAALASGALTTPDGLTVDDGVAVGEDVSRWLQDALDALEVNVNPFVVHVAGHALAGAFLLRAQKQARLLVPNSRVSVHLEGEGEQRDAHMVIQWRTLRSTLPLLGILREMLYVSIKYPGNGLREPFVQALVGLDRFLDLPIVDGTMMNAHPRETLQEAFGKIMRSHAQDTLTLFGNLADDPRYAPMLDWRVAREALMLQVAYDQGKGVSQERIVLRLEDGLKRMRADYPDVEVSLSSDADRALVDRLRASATVNA